MADGAERVTESPNKRKRAQSGLLGRIEQRALGQVAAPHDDAPPLNDDPNQFELAAKVAAWPTFAQPHVTYGEKKHALDVSALDLDCHLGLLYSFLSFLAQPKNLKRRKAC